MSLLSDFSRGGFNHAATVIGAQTFTIAGGTAVSSVPNEVRHSKDFEDGGFAPDTALELVCNRDVFDLAYTSAPETYINSLATTGSVVYRLTSLSVGAAHVVLTLEHSDVSLVSIELTDGENWELLDGTNLTLSI